MKIPNILSNNIDRCSTSKCARKEGQANRERVENPKEGFQKMKSLGLAIVREDQIPKVIVNQMHTIIDSPLLKIINCKT